MIRRRTGASAIEFALTLPVLVILIAAIVEYGWVFHQRAQIVRAVREGVRYAVIGPSDEVPDPAVAAEERTAEVLEQLSFDLDTATIEVDMQDLHDDGAGEDDTLTLTATVVYKPLMNGLIPSPGSLGASLTMMLAGDAS